MSQVINRLSITGDIGIYTPLCVIDEICKVYNLKTNYKLNSLSLINDNIRKKSIINDTEDTDDTNAIELIKIVKYVNPAITKWKTKALLYKAYNFLNSFIIDKKATKELLSNGYGLQTTENLYSLNACVLYRLCCNIGIYVRKEASIEDMYNYLTLYIKDKDEMTKNMIPSISKLRKVELINLSSMNPDVMKNVYTFKKKEILITINPDNLKEYLANNANLDLLTLIRPRNNEEAIMLGARLFGVDLTYISNPIEVYNNSEYSNRDIFILKDRFNPVFTIEYYKELELYNLIIFEGIDIKSIVSDASFMELMYYEALSNIGETFHTLNNIHSSLITNAVTYITHSNVNIEKPTKYVAYGTYDSKKELTFYKFKDLVDIFNKDGNFGVFTATSMNKLANIANLYNEVELITTIENIKDNLESLKYKTDLSLNSCDQDYIIEIMTKLFKLAITVRGWNNEMNEDDTYNFNKDKVTDVDDFEDRYTDILMSITEDDNPEKSKVLDFPIIRYNFNDNSFYIKNDGYKPTISDRLKLSMKGDTTGDINSCIKNFSDKILSTTWYYLNRLDVKLGFTLKEVVPLEGF